MAPIFLSHIHVIYTIHWFVWLVHKQLTSSWFGTFPYSHGTLTVKVTNLSHHMIHANLIDTDRLYGIVVITEHYTSLTGFLPFSLWSFACQVISTAN